MLADRGLPSALAALAGRCTVPVELVVDAELGMPRGRLDAAVENTAYFAVAEALTNVAKHSGAANCWVTVANGPGRLAVQIVDDGGGGAHVAKGHGLSGLADRVRATGGALDSRQPGWWADRDQSGAAVLRVVVADDSVLLREGLVRLLAENGHDVVAAVGDGPSLVNAIEQHRPDVSVVDVRMPPSHTDEGLRAAVEARRAGPRFPVLVLSQYVELSYADDLLADRAGGVGYLLKDRVAAVAEFLDALGRVASGGTVLDPEVVGQLLVRRRRDDPLKELTPREREVLALMAEGRSNGNIARTLVIADGSVEKHVRNIFTKLTLPPDLEQNRRVLAVLAYLSGYGPVYESLTARTGHASGTPLSLWLATVDER